MSQNTPDRIPPLFTSTPNLTSIPYSFSTPQVEHNGRHTIPGLSTVENGNSINSKSCTVQDNGLDIVLCNVVSNRHGIIEVNTTTSHHQNVTLTSKTSVSQRQHTPLPIAELSYETRSAEMNEELGQTSDTVNERSSPFEILDACSPVVNLNQDFDIQQMLHSGKQVFHILAQLPGTDPIQRVVVVKPDQDAELAMSNAVSDVTQVLNRKAAQKIAQGFTLDQETVIEITRIVGPTEGHEKEKIVDPRCEPQSSKVEGSRTHHPRKSPLLKRREQTPSPPICSDSQEYSSQLHTTSEYYPSQSSYDDFSFDEDSQLDSQDHSMDSCMNDSLTNIQWLGHMKGDNLQVVSHKDMRLIASEKQIEKVNLECGKDKRPPYSYMHLIQMAICSKPDKKMTLKDIYTWIEAKFPYYKSNPNKGWRNSIRHNLSLYDIFVRERRDFPGKSSLSYWTMRSDIKPKPAVKQTNLDDSLLVKTDCVEAASPVYCLEEEIKAETQPQPPKKRPVPLLPKPNPQDSQGAYALIPIQGGVPVIPSQPILLPANWTNTHFSIADSVGELQQNLGSTPSVHVPHRKHVKIAPKFHPAGPSHIAQSQACPGHIARSLAGPSHTAQSLCQRKHTIQHTVNSARRVSHEKTNPSTSNASLSSQNDAKTGYKESILIGEATYNQAETVWESSDSTNLKKCSAANESSDLSNHARSLDSGIVSDLSNHARSLDSGIVSDLSNPLDSGITSSFSEHSDIGNSWTGLPKPQLYSETVVRRSKRKRKSPHSSLIQSSPNGGGHLVINGNTSHLGITDLLAGIEKNLVSPARQLLKTPPKSGGNMLTSTPLKQALDSPVWISPIRGLSEDLTPPGKAKRKRVAPSNAMRILQRNVGSPQLGSLRSLGLAGFTPLKSRENIDGEALGESTFGRLLGDMHLDSIIDEGINDMEDISFSHLAM